MIHVAPPAPAPPRIARTRAPGRPRNSAHACGRPFPAVQAARQRPKTASPSDALCLTFGNGTGAVTTESHGGLHGRLDAAALRDRLRQLQPSTATLLFHMGPDADFLAGVILGTAIGMLAATGIPIEHPPLPPTATAPNGAALH